MESIELLKYVQRPVSFSGPSRRYVRFQLLLLQKTLLRCEFWKMVLPRRPACSSTEAHCIVLFCTEQAEQGQATVIETVYSYCGRITVTNATYCIRILDYIRISRICNWFKLYKLLQNIRFLSKSKTSGPSEAGFAKIYTKNQLLNVFSSTVNRRIQEEQESSRAIFGQAIIIPFFFLPLFNWFICVSIVSRFLFNLKF